MADTINVYKFRGDYDFLSNMYDCNIDFTIDGKLYHFGSTEAAYQANKCPSRASEFEGLTGVEAKKLGRLVTVRPDWDNIKYDIMRELIDIKFNNKSLRRKLAQIDGEIVEGNHWHDTYWGVCNGVGQNKLGQLLMQKRDQIIKQKTAYKDNMLDEDVEFSYNADGTRATILKSPCVDMVGQNFKTSFGNHTFTKDELCELARGNEISITDFKTKHGDVIDITGKLGECVNTINGAIYFGFKRIDMMRCVSMIASQVDDNMSFYQPDIN